MEIVTFNKINEVYLKVDCEMSTLYELRDFFTFKVPGYQFSPKFKAKLWNGDIHLFDIRSRQLYVGLLTEAIKFCEDRGYKVKLENIQNAVEFSVVEAQEFIKKLKLPFEPRDYQIDAFVHAIRNRRHILVCPTGSGKSLILYLIMSYLYQNHKKGLLIVPTINLVEQMAKDFTSYSVNNGFDVDKMVHKIYQGKEKSTKKYLTISTWQSLQSEPTEFFEDFDFFLGDECHLFSAKSLTGIATKLTNADYRIGDTGSLDDSKCHHLVLQGLFGSIRNVTTTKKLIDANHLSDFEIKALILKHPEDKCKVLQSNTYQEEIDYLINSESRNKFIENLALSLDGNTLVLFQLVEKHGEILYKDLITRSPERRIFFISGKVGIDIRERIREIVEKEKNAIIVASFGTFSTGVNIRNLHNVIFASPSKSRVRNLQSIGRVLRLSDDNSVATLYDIVDDLRYKKWENFTLKHFGVRLKLYVSEKFKHKLYKIDLK